MITETRRRNITFVLFFVSLIGGYSQVNFVNNPSFEENYSCASPNHVPVAKYWNPTDSLQFGTAGDYFSTCYPNVPKSGITFQYAKSGGAYIRNTPYCTPSYCAYPYMRTYPKNRMRSNLVNGQTYCVSFYVNLINPSPLNIDAYQALLTDATVDTIKYNMIPLTYLTPQITNTLGLVGDTLNWTKISNTFVANGTEKYIIIGNFKPDAATNTGTTGVAGCCWSEYMLDDVSVIDFNLPAFAGPDKNITLGDSAFIGRPPEIGLECTWATGTTTIGTGGGLWVKPTTIGTFSYVVTQNICGNIKTDTVNVNISSGINENIAFAQSISVYPQPAKDLVNISLSNYYEPTVDVKIIDVDGRIVSSVELAVRNGKAQLETSELSNGVYILQITNGRQQTVSKRLVIAK